MRLYNLKVVLKPHMKEANGRRYLNMDVTADNDEQAIDFSTQMLQPLLKEDIKLTLFINNHEEIEN